jgi:hypothetical protein
MKYWDSGLNASSSRTFKTRVHIAAAVIDRKRSGKERTRQTQFSTKFLTGQTQFSTKFLTSSTFDAFTHLVWVLCWWQVYVKSYYLLPKKPF